MFIAEAYLIIFLNYQTKKKVKYLRIFCDLKSFWGAYKKII